MLVVLARMAEVGELRQDIKELKDRQDILATALQIALEELETLQKEKSEWRLYVNTVESRFISVSVNRSSLNSDSRFPIYFGKRESLFKEDTSAQETVWRHIHSTAVACDMTFATPVQVKDCGEVDSQEKHVL